MAKCSFLTLMGIVLIPAVMAIPAQGALIVRISDLQHSPAPPNPIELVGRVTSVSPLTLSDGRGEVTVSGITGNIGDVLVLQGNWDGGGFTVDPSLPQQDYVTTPVVSQMVYVPAGAFLMGNSGVGDDATYPRADEVPQHSVYLDGFWIGKYDVTRGEYARFIAAGGYSNSAYWSTDGWAWRTTNNRTQPDYWDSVQDWGSGNFAQTDSFPVVGVSYYEAEAYCNWALCHLPTEAQWEKAARWAVPTGSGTGHPRIYPWGDTWDVEKCNNYFDSNAAGGGYEEDQTSPVGSYSAGVSPYGCEDMAGDVWDWCQDWYDPNYYSQTPAGGWVNPQGSSNSAFGRVRRGGSWYSSYSFYFSCAFRYYDGPAYGRNYAGFRLAR